MPLARGAGRARARGSRGPLVFFNHAMSAGGQDYGDASTLRSHGPAAASKAGAVGALVRSLATASLRTRTPATTRRGDGHAHPRRRRLGGGRRAAAPAAGARPGERSTSVLGCVPGLPAAGSPPTWWPRCGAASGPRRWWCWAPTSTPGTWATGRHRRRRRRGHGHGGAAAGGAPAGGAAPHRARGALHERGERAAGRAGPTPRPRRRAAAPRGRHGGRQRRGAPARLLGHGG